MRLIKRVFANDLLGGLFVGLLIILPIAVSVISSNGVLAPLNILPDCCGWEYKPVDAVYNAIPSDVTDFVLPDRYFLKESMLQGDVALWNPLYYGGEIFLANLQSTVFHPINIFLYILSPLDVQTISVIMSIFFMAVFMYMMLRKLHASISASTMGAIIFALSPFASFWSTFGMMTWMMACFPLVVYLLISWYESKKLHFLAIMSIVLGFSTLMGHIQFSFVAFVLPTLLAAAYFLSSKADIKKRTRDIATVGVFVVLGGLIGSVQLLPFLEQSAIGHRNGTSLGESSVSASRVIYDIKNYVSPFLYKSNADQSYYADHGPFYFSITAFGALLSIFGIARGITQKHKYSLFFMGLFIGGVLWMWGSIPQQILIFIASIFESLRPRYFISIPLFAGAVLAAFGHDYIVNIAKRYIKKHKKIVRSQRFTRYSALIALLSAVVFSSYGIAMFMPAVRDQIGRYDTVVFYAAFIALWAYAVIFFGDKKSGLKKLLYMAAVPIFVSIQVFALFFATQPIVPRDVFEQGNPYYTAIHNDIGEGNSRNERLVYPFPPQTNLYHNIGALNGYDSLYAKSIENTIDYINYPEKTIKLSEASRNAIYVSNTDKTNVLYNLGVGYIIAEASKPDPEGYRELFAKDYFTVYKAKKSTPQVYFASKITQANEKRQAEMIKQDEYDYHEVAVDHSELKSAVASSKDSVKYDIFTNHIEITASAGGDRLLFVGQTHRPQWSATTEDGTPLNIYKADYNYMAVAVPKGQHTITLRYQPLSYSIGLAVTLVTLTAVAGVIVISTRQTRGKHAK